MPPIYSNLTRFRGPCFIFRSKHPHLYKFPRSPGSHFGSKDTYSIKNVAIHSHVAFFCSPSLVQLLLISSTLHNYICRYMYGSADYCLPSNSQWPETAISEWVCNAYGLQISALLRSRQQQALCGNLVHFLHFNNLHLLIAAAVVRPFDPYSLFVLEILSTIYTHGNKLLYVCWFAKITALHNFMYVLLRPFVLSTTILLA